MSWTGRFFVLGYAGTWFYLLDMVGLLPGYL